MTNIPENRTRSIARGTCFLCFLLVPVTYAAELIPLGFLPGAENSSASDVSDDGSVVVGTSDGGFRWTAESGMVALENLPSGRHPRGASGISIDGTVVVGDAQTGFGALESYRWTLASGMEGLGVDRDNEAAGVSADGSVVVGRGSPQSSNQAYRWTRAEGRLGLGGCCDCCAIANGVSANGMVVVGRAPFDSHFGAFVWTREDGMIELGGLPGNNSGSTANGVSADGKVIVGSGITASGLEAILWGSERDAVGLGDLPGGDFESEATAVSADGSVVVGNSQTASGNEGFVWTQAAGLERLHDVLVANGTGGLSGWSGLTVGGMSDNGQWVVGTGTNPSGFNEAFLVELLINRSQDFEINAGLNDAWYNPATNGQGLLFTVFPTIQQMFVAWFTFDAERPPGDITASIGEPGHRWLTAQGPYSADTATLTIYMTEGGVFDSADPVASTDPAGDGTLTIEFADCSNAIATYEITSASLSGTIPLERIANDNVTLCETLASQ
jgi:probable HAF family extracellular repeat protein